MAKKPSKTALNIRSINSYIQTIANTFGVNSAEYQSATVPLKQFDIRDKTVNGQIIVQIKNTAANRKKHQTIRAIRNKRKPVQILKRKYDRMRQAQTATLPSIERGEQAKDFYRWYAEMSKRFSDLENEIYGNGGLANSLGAIGQTPSSSEIHAMFKDNSYRMEQWEHVYDNGGKNYTNMEHFIDSVDDTILDGIDVSTGEDMTFTNADYTDTDMEFD